VKEALFYQKQENDSIQCNLCPHICKIIDKKRGLCGVRENRNGKLYSLVYNKSCSLSIDPIEKKPLYHFYPGTKTFSLATVGCNFFCKGCQNWSISRGVPKKHSEEVSPEQIINMCIERECKIISYTYTEPTVYFEYMLEIAKLARKQGIKNTIVSNGFINQPPLRELSKYLDAANIDLKAFNDNFYKEYCKARIGPVLDTLKLLKEKEIWLEITNLLITDLNDNKDEFEQMCVWIKKELGQGVPLHISRFFPHYKCEVPPTPESILNDAVAIAKKHLDYVYLGNIFTDSNTYCPKCKKILIQRMSKIVTNSISKNACSCGKNIEGIWR